MEDSEILPNSDHFCYANLQTRVGLFSYSQLIHLCNYNYTQW